MAELYEGPHQQESCPCKHPLGDHDLMPTQRAPGDPVQGEWSCRKCRRLADVRTKSEAALLLDAGRLSEQAERFLAQFPEVDLSEVERSDEGELIATAANAYERLNVTERTADQAKWYQAENVDGRSARYLKERLWDIVEEARRRKRTGS